MDEIKFRFRAVTDIVNKVNTTSYAATNIEFVFLQIRKILELIALASLVANKQLFEEQKIKFDAFWHAERILKSIEKLNPGFYPRSVEEVLSADPKFKTDLRDKTEGYLTKQEFVELYNQCSKMLHSSNPFGSKVNLEDHENGIGSSLSKIMGLLKTHQIKLVDDDNLYLIHMVDDASGLAHGYTFKKTA